MDLDRARANKLKHRGKLYALSEDSAWEDTGTGYATVVGTGDSKRLIFEDGDTGKVLHDRPVFSSDAYQLQGEDDRQTIIVWEDSETQKDWALSFQDADGTAEICELITGESRADEKRVLPIPTLGSLGELCRLLTCVPPTLREVLAAECLSSKFLTGLRETFHTAEDLLSEEALSSLWQIVKGVFLLSNQKLTERYLQPDVYEDILGMLEYDAGLPCSKRIAHRQVLKTQVCFKEVLNFEDTDIMERVHLNYRLQYLKDIVLPRLLDDAAFVSLTAMIHTNLSVILDHVQRTARLLEQLFLQIWQKDKLSLLFLQDLCRLAKQLAPSERQVLHDKMVTLQMFSAICPFFEAEAAAVETEVFPDTRCICVEIVLLSAQNDPSPLRRFLTADGTEGRALLTALIRTLLYWQDQGVQAQVAELLKAVLETATLEPRERDACLDTFYDRGALDDLLAPQEVDASGKPSTTPSSLFGQQLSCELFAFAVARHGYQARSYVVRQGVAQQAMRLLSMPQRFLQLAPVRLLRAAVGTRDDAYHRYLAKSGLFAPLFRAFEQSLRPPALGGNLLVSATLEVLEFIRVENIKILVDHICRKHEALLREYAPKLRTLHLFLLKHEQNLEYEAFPPEQHAAGGPISAGAGGAGTTRSGRMRSPGREDSDDDEAYFDSLDEDDVEEPPAAEARAPSPGAVTTEDALEAQCSEPPSSGQDQDVDTAASGGAADGEEPGGESIVEATSDEAPSDDSAPIEVPNHARKKLKTSDEHADVPVATATAGECAGSENWGQGQIHQFVLSAP